MKWKGLKPEIWVLVVLVVGAAGFFIWDRYFTYDPAEVYANAKKQYVEAMTADTYGGKTPQETLDLFVAALKKENIDLASKYFLLDENLSRDEWVKYLTGIKEENLILKMASDIEKLTKPVQGDSKNDFAFEILNKNGIVSVLIDMKLNTFSNVWKIESI